VKIVFAGTPQTAVPSLRALVASDHEVVGVVTNPDAAKGRSGRLVASPVAQVADELGIPVLKPPRARDEDFKQALAALAPDICAVTAWGSLIPDDVLAMVPHGWVNLHFSLLPRWRGAAPVQRALMAGDTTTGVTTFQIVRDLDAGPIYRQVETRLWQRPTAGDLLEQLADSGAQVLVDTINDIAAGVRPTPQSSDDVTLAPKLTHDECRIDWSAPAEDIARLVAGASPNPGAWTTLDGMVFKVLRAEVVDQVVRNPGPGVLLATKRDLYAGTKYAVVLLKEIVPAGKKPMSGADWARGAKPEPGTRFV
jgi:methionyl-tRNA formyltransferase